MSIVEQLMSINPQEKNVSEPDPDNQAREDPADRTADSPAADPDAIEEVDFDYGGYQVVRGEFFAHLNEPSITFNQEKLSVNTACIRRLPAVDYVQVLINQETKKLVLKASTEDAKDSFLWTRESKSKRMPKPISCRVFFAKLVSLMNWNPDYRYKLLGKILRSGEDTLVVFDLTSVETYIRKPAPNGKTRSSRKPLFPEEWKNQFGLPVEEHKKLLQVNIFDGFTVFGIKDPSQNVTDEKTSSGGEA